MAKKSPSFAVIFVSLLAVLFVLAVATVLIGSSLVNSYLRGEQFRSLVATKTGEVLHATVTCGPLNWTGGSAYTDSMEADGAPGSPMDKIEASQIRADINWRSILQGAWRVDQINIVRMDGAFRPAAPGNASAPTDAVQAPPAPATGLRALLPRRFELGSLNVGEAGFVFKNAQGAQVAEVKKSSLILQPDGPGWSASGRDGTLLLTGLPQLAITDFRLRQQNGKVFVTDSNFRLGDNGKISASGEFGDGANVRLEWQQIDVDSFLSSDWKNRLSGSVAGNANVQWPENGTATASGQFNLTHGLLQNLPMLEQVATFTGAPEFRRMPLQQVSGDFAYANGIITITNFVTESKGLMRIEGSLRVANGGALDGTFRVGVTPQTLQWLPGSRERVFTTAENGYLWTNVRIGGTLQNLQEDLSTRLVMAAKDQVIDQGVKTLENAPGGAVQGAQGVLDILNPLVK